jgi:PleD family two-component response regulator
MSDAPFRPAGFTGTEATMLLAESHYPTVAAFRDIAHKNGLNTHVVTNGTQALEVLRHHTPALVVLSAELETINGFEVCSRMKLIKRLRGVPVLLLSNMVDARVIDASAIVHADGLLGKPVQPTEAHEFVMRLTRPKVYGTNLTQPLRVLQVVTH